MTGVVWQVRSTLSIFAVLSRWRPTIWTGRRSTAPRPRRSTLGCETHERSLLRLAVVPGPADHLGSPRPRASIRGTGTYVSLSLQGGGGPLGGDFDYVRVLPDARVYTASASDNALTLSARLRAGELWPWSGNPDDSAVVTRFYAGGAISMRGFSDRRLSPLLLVPPPPGAPNVQLTVPIGGNGLIDGSFEARYSVTKSLRVAAFVDFGQVTHGRLTPGDMPNVMWAVGVGVRLITPIGPIRVDLARRLPFGDLPTLYAVDAAGAIAPVPYVANNSCFGLWRLERGHAGRPTACACCTSRSVRRFDRGSPGRSRGSRRRWLLGVLAIIALARRRHLDLPADAARRRAGPPFRAAARERRARRARSRSGGSRSAAIG